MSRSVARQLAHRSLRALASTTCIFGMLAAASAVYAQSLFQTPSPTLVADSTPQAVATGDFARSGFQSMVVTNSASNTMKVYLANGPASFASPSTYSTCTDPTAVTVADVNYDGYPDIVVTCTSGNSIQLWLNEGASNPGAFSLDTSESVSSPVAVVTGDFVGNGEVDAAVAGAGGVTVFVNQNNSGSFTTNFIPISGTLTGIVAGDFNKDGNLDLAVSDSQNNNVHVLLGDGTGNFTVHGSYSTGSGTKPAGIVAADFNRDGNLDVATVNSGNNTVAVLLGNGNGSLQAPIAQSTGTNPISIVTTDVNSDGIPDVITFDAPTTSTGEMDVLLGNGNGSLQAPQVSSYSFEPGVFAAVADFNRDGKPDLAVTGQSTNNVSVLLNNTLPTQYPDGRSYSAANEIAAGNGNMADAVAAADFNKNGRTDIAVSYLEDNVVRVLDNNGGGGFSLVGTYPVGNQPYDVVAADLNGDGYPDLVTANTNPNSANGSVSVLLNNRNGTFASAVNYTVGHDPYQVAVGDLNNDGIADIAVTNYASNTVSILIGSKNGTFTVSPTTLATCSNPYGVAIADFAHNHFPSIAVTCYGTSQLEVFPNNGNGTFGSPFIYAVPVAANGLVPHPGSLVVGDFNRDGNLDIVTGNTIANDVSFFAGNGDNTFQAGVISPSLNFPATIAAGDVNGDGILDIVGVAPNYNQVEVTLGKGDGTFGTFQQRDAGRFNAHTQPWGIALGDFLHHGQLDIVTANTFHQVNIALPAYQQRYIKQYPPVRGGNPSVDLLTNQSPAKISFSANPASPLPPNNTGTKITATVQPAVSGPTPTGSVIFENSAGAPIGSGPVPLVGGQASMQTGHLGSGSYLFTTLYSGDSNFQPTTASGSSFALAVSGTPVTLTLNPSTVSYGGTFTATATVTGTTGLGAPTGSVTIYGVGLPNPLGTFNVAASGNNATGSVHITAVTPLDVGTYQLYALYTPSNGNYQAGSSPSVTLTVTTTPTTLTNFCLSIFVGGCVAEVHPAVGPPVTQGVVDFTVTPPGGAPTPEGLNGNGLSFFFYAFGVDGDPGQPTYTVTATFVPANNDYSGSSATTTVSCTYFGPFAFCAGAGGGGRGLFSFPLNSFTGMGQPGGHGGHSHHRRSNLQRMMPLSLY